MKKIAYIMSRFPQLSETFILREMIALEQLGWNFSLYPLIMQNEAVVHAEARDWLKRARYSPWFSASVLSANLRRLIKHPISYASLWFRTLAGNLRSPQFLWRAVVIFPKAVLMAEEMQAEGLTHIHVHFATHPALTAWIIHQLTGISYSITAHAHDIYMNRTMLEPKIRDAAFVVAISDFNRQFLGKHLGEWAADKTHVVHCGIQPERFAPAKTLTPVKESTKTFEIVSIGSLQPYKGQRYLVDACEILRQRGIDFRCRIIGGGELKSELETLIAEKKLGDRIQLAGPLPQDVVAQILPQADCYVQPSIIAPSGQMEGIPVALMEALACALPVVATDISGISELVRPAQTGTLVPPENPQALAEAMLAIHADFEGAKAMAWAGRELVMQEFDLYRNVRQLSALFQAF
jgi:glycosyltransferase involved in cell wall biosynthesis